MKEKEPYAMDQSEQTTVSEQQMPASKNGVFMMRGEGQSFEEFVEACVQSFKDKGLLKPRPQNAGSNSLSNEQNLPDEKNQQ